MKKGSDNTRRTHIVAVLLWFGLFSAAATVMFFTALITWLSELMHSSVAALSVVGVLLAIAALVLYLTSVRSAVERLRDGAETIYSVARGARDIYNWVLDKYRFLSLLLTLLRRGRR